MFLKHLPGNNNSHNSDNSFKFSSLDLLNNPLRKSFPLETLSPYEIALFNCWICKFGTNFDLCFKYYYN